MLRLTQTGVGVGQVADLPGAVHLVLPPEVGQLDPASAVFEGMLAGWERQQKSRFLRSSTMAQRAKVIRRFALFTGLYPWQWTAGEVEAFIADLLSGPAPLAHSTVRSYQLSLRLFCEFITDARYGWAVECDRRFGAAPAQICHEWNTVAHVSDYEGRPGRRALSYDEVQALFDAADARVERISASGRKGTLAAMRDAAFVKTVYAFGLRRREAVRLDGVDLHRNPRMPRFADMGAVQVRWGKASRGSPPKRRTVLTVPEMDWVLPVLAQWREEVRPLLAPASHPALWVTERRSRVSLRHINDVFVELRAAAGLPESADLHSLRHSYVTHLLEFGYPQLFVQQQVGHAHASTTSLYTSVSDEFRNRLVERALGEHPELWEVR
jgi:site-specific recombinase XerD